MGSARTRSPTSSGSETTASSRRRRGEDGARVPLVFRALTTGAILAALDAGLGLSRGGDYFLGWVERNRFVAGALSFAFAVALVAHGAGAGVERLCRFGGASPARAERRAARVWAALAGAASATLLGFLTTGRRVVDHPLRWPSVLVLATFLALSAWAIRRRKSDAGPRWLGAMGAVALAAAVADVTVLPRLYPAFHLGLSLLATVAATVATWGLPSARLYSSGRSRGLAWALLLAVAAFGLYRGHRVAEAPNLSFAARSVSPILGKAVALRAAIDRLRAEPIDEAEGGPAALRTRDGLASSLSLGDRDVLLITVDALRADRLQAYGGRGRTPEIDALAEESRVFLRAYTPTPHTSYALSSLLTGKYLRPVFALPDAPKDHPTLPRLLRRYGFRTAAFYPPAIFFVDEERFRELRADGLGFEYRKEMYTTPEQRVAQVERYLSEIDDDMPVFVWVHFFAPHEPYDPPAELARGRSAEARYDGEVAWVDGAVGELVRELRSARPDAAVILSADHGEEFGDHGGYYHGSTLYDEQVRVPLLWSVPGEVAPGSTTAPVDLVDVATTILRSAGIPLDARMRGDDLGSLLRDPQAEGPSFAFSDIGDARMVTDGRYKAICAVGARGCALFDLVRDPSERVDRSSALPDVHRRLRGALGDFVGSIPRIEAMAVEGQVGWPEALARAALGDPEAAAAVEPLLGDSRAAVRAAGAKALGALGHRPALPVLRRLSTDDPDPDVRAEATLARLALSDEEALPAVRAIVGSDVTTEKERARARRAAALLATVGDASGLSLLRSAALDSTADESLRREAIEALGELGSGRAVGDLVALLDDVRLRPHAARALASIGDPSAIPPLRRALAAERYLGHREMEARALLRLGDRRLTPLLLRWLGTPEPMGAGLELLEASGGLDGRGRWLLGDERRIGELPGLGWSCGEEGCISDGGARIPIPEARGMTSPRLVVELAVPEGGATVTLGGGEPKHLGGGVQLLSHLLPDEGEDDVALISRPNVRLRGFAVVEAREELPPPPPEPWRAAPDAGASGGAPPLSVSFDQ